MCWRCTCARQGGIQEPRNSITAGSDGAYIEWLGLDFEVEDKRILSEISGAVHPGQVLAIMGTEGTTTALNPPLATPNAAMAHAALFNSPLQ